MDHFDRWNILTDKQHGFRSRISYESQLIITIDALAKSLAKEEQVGQYVPTVEMVHYLAVNDMFQYFTRYDVSETGI
jgi:hypothetical protein